MANRKSGYKAGEKGKAKENKDLTVTEEKVLEAAEETAAEAPAAAEEPAAEAAAAAEETAEAAPQAASSDEKIRELEESMAEMKQSLEALRKQGGAAAAVKKAASEIVSVDEMNILSSGVSKIEKLSKKRSAEILGVFAKHNFYANGLTPVELRTTLEDLGPTYVKIGQIMSSRVDLLPESYCKELEKLRQNVQPLEARLARAVIEEQTGKRIEDIYSEFRDKPLGSASIGQAHYAVLKDGRRVVTKVRRPYIADMMRQDYILLKRLAGGIQVMTEGDDNAEEQVDLIEVIRELEQVTEEELDFRTEAKNMQLFKEKCIEDPEKVSCPDVVEELTTECMFTMSFVDGYSISKKERAIEEGCDVEKIARAIVENYVHQILDVGIFHADPHQGNIMISGGKPVWIDFGMLGRISEADIKLIQSLVLAVLEKDAETIANCIMGMGASTSQTNRDRLMEDVDAFLDRYTAVSSINDLDMGALFNEILSLAEKHHIKMPGRFTMLIRSLTTIEGVIEQFCPELNLFEIISNKMLERAKQSFNLEQELAALGQDALEIGRKAARIPALASDVLKGVARGRTKINLELTGYDELVKKGAATVRNVVIAFFACILFFGSCVLCLTDIEPKAPGGMPAIAAVGMVFSVALAIHAIGNLTKK